jgi:CRISPR-associated protein Cas2
MRYLYCYDIANAKRLRAVCKLLEGKGIRIQRSFFICDLEYNPAIALLNEVKEILSPRFDSVYMYGICDSCQRKVHAIGAGAYHILEDFKIL